MQSQVYRRRQVCLVTGLSYSTIHRMECRGLFPRRVQLSPNCVGWPVDAVKAYLRSRTPSPLRGLQGAGHA